MMLQRRSRKLQTGIKKLQKRASKHLRNLHYGGDSRNSSLQNIAANTSSSERTRAGPEMKQIQTDRQAVSGLRAVHRFSVKS